MAAAKKPGSSTTTSAAKTPGKQRVILSAAKPGKISLPKLRKAIREVVDRRAAGSGGC
jgi:hypothetical protein